MWLGENLNIFLITGVNGAGKTTLIGKLAHLFTKLNQKVLIASIIVDVLASEWLDYLIDKTAR